MIKYLVIGGSRALLLCSAIVLTGCSEDDPPSTTSGGNNAAGILTCPTAEQQSADGTCEESSSGTDTGTDTSTSPKVLALETQIKAELNSSGHHIYRVASEASISLFSDTGNVDLILYDNLEDIDPDNPYNDEKLVCASGFSFKGDTCTASVDDGELYALVYAQTDSSYRIDATAECSVPTINKWVYRNMLDYYLYFDQIPDVDTDTFADPSDLVDALRYEPLEPYSWIGDAKTTSRLVEDGFMFGLGYGWSRDENEDLRIRYVSADSPFGKAGVKRGDIMLTLNSESLSDISNERFREMVGSEENQVTSTWTLIDGDTGQNKTISVVNTEYRFDSVLYTNVFTSPSMDVTVGYLVFKQFIEPSVDELNTAIKFFKDAGVTDLVLDLRYNRGGRSRVSERFSSQLAGPVVANKVLSRDVHNAKYSQLDYEDFFPEASPSLGLSRLIVLTTGQSASASERLISALSPYIEVVKIGSTTAGKAFRSSGREYCGKVLNAMTTQGVNSVGVGVAGGISADCYAADDLSNDFGLGEGMLESALNYIANGTCLAAPAIAAHSADALNRKSIETRELKSDEQLLLDRIIE